MLDARFIRENVAVVEEALRKRSYEISLEPFLKIEEDRRNDLRLIEELRNIRNVVSAKIGELKRLKKEEASNIFEKNKETRSFEGTILENIKIESRTISVPIFTREEVEADKLEEPSGEMVTPIIGSKELIERII